MSARDTHRAERDAEILYWLGKKSLEYRSTGSKQDVVRADVIALMASKISRGAVRPNNTLLPDGVTPDFFQPGHGYTHLDGHDFLCVTVTTHPRTGRLYAMGWISEGGQLHRPAVEDINAWRHEYDGCKPPDEGPTAAYASTRGEPGGDA